MTFNSFAFLLFYPVVALLYFVLPKKIKPWLLLLASYYFYAAAEPLLVLLILATTATSYVSARFIAKETRPRVRKTWLFVGVSVSLLALGFFKYADFVLASVASVASLFGAGFAKTSLGLLLPVGISFYTFQTLSYVIDVYRQRIEPEKNFFWYALFVSFFPQLVAGPIERPENLLPQLKEDHPFSFDRAKRGFAVMLLGFVKKIAVADTVAAYVNAVYNSPESASGLGVFLATLLFSVQIYCDFSGYTDIAVGAAWIMGIRLMQNFNHPYMATSVRDFWSRWHISLSGWLRDYLYIPLGGNRCSKVRHLFNLLIVFFVSGLWHGAAWTFVLWGLLHGVYEIVGVLTVKRRDALLSRVGLSPDGKVVTVVRRVLTFALVAFAWIFFRANSVADLGVLLGKLCTGWGVPLSETLSSMGVTLIGALTVIFAIALLLLLDRLVVYGEDGQDGASVLTGNGAFVLFLWVIFSAWMLLLSHNAESSFIYFRF